MTVSQAVSRIKEIQMQALKMAAQVGLSHVMPLVPISKVHEGGLRSTGRVEISDDSVDIVFGGKGTVAEKYAAYQYSKAQYHLTDGKSLGRILEAFASSAEARKHAGKEDHKRYAAAYRWAVKNRILTKFPGGVRWFRILLEDGMIQRRMSQVYANYLKSAIGGSRAA